jgi:hypothetical protein
LTAKNLTENKPVTLQEALELPDDELIVCGSKQTIIDKKHFILEFAKTGNLSKTAQLLHLSTWNIYDKWFTDPDFQDAFKKAELQHLDRMAAEADRRAMEGVDKGIYWQGERVATEKQYSDNLLMFRMKKIDPAYRDGTQLNLNQTNVEIKRIVVNLAQPTTNSPVQAIDITGANE